MPSRTHIYISPQAATAICQKEFSIFRKVPSTGESYLLKTGAELHNSDSCYIIYGYACDGSDLEPYRKYAKEKEDENLSSEPKDVGRKG